MKKKNSEVKPKILVVCQHYWPENFRINDIVDFFVEQNCEVDVLCGIPNYPTGKFFDGYGYLKNRKQVNKNVHVRRVFEVPRGNNSNLRIVINYLSFPIASIFHIPRLCFKKYNKIFLYSLSPVYMSIAGIILGKLRKTETTMYVLDLWPENLYSVLPLKNNLLRALIKFTSHWHYRNVDKLIVLSAKMKNHMVSEIGVDANNIIVLPQTTEKIYETELHDKNLVKRFKNTFNILYTGNISPAQSHKTIMEAALILKNAGFKDIRWIIVGDGMSARDMKNDVSSNDLSKEFVFEGIKPIEDIPKYTPLADVLVGCLVKSQLLEATIPAKVMSYIAAGRPIALAMDGEVKEIIEKTIKCGYVSETENAKRLAENIERIYNMSPQDRSRLGKRARDYHFKHYERNIVLHKLYNFIFT